MIELLPIPRLLVRRAGELSVPRHGTIAGEAATERLCRMFERVAGDSWSIGDDGVIAASFDSSLPPQGYRLIVTADHATIVSGDAAGVFYGACTLAQLVDANRVQCVEIEDYPDLAVRGVMLDISRDKVPTMSTPRELVDMLASWKINQLQLYVEHTFAYRAHPDVWAAASPLTAEEIAELNIYCRERFANTTAVNDKSNSGEVDQKGKRELAVIGISMSDFIGHPVRFVKA